MHTKPTGRLLKDWMMTMISTTNNFALTCWYMDPYEDKRIKALLFDICNGRATLLLESGQFVTDDAKEITIDGAADLFKQCIWMDGDNE